MPCPSRLSVALLSLAALCCAGCELPHGPLRWDPVYLDWHHLDLLPRGELHAPGPFQITDDCEEHVPAPCHSNHGHSHHAQRDPQPIAEHDPRAAASNDPRLTRHHHAVPLAGPGINAPWPKFHPVPTRPAFEPQCLVPVPETAQHDTGVVLLNGQADRK